MFATHLDESPKATTLFDLSSLLKDDGVRIAGGAGPAQSLLLKVLDEVNHGLLLVNECGEVGYANRVAMRDCGAGQPLHYDGQRLLAARAAEHDTLMRALSAARDGRRTILILRSASSSISVGVIPVAGDRGGDDTVALLVLGKRTNCDPLSLQFFAQMHKLTPAESAVLGALCEGLRPTQVAQRGGVALSTVRSQISNIRQKTRASSVDHVVRMVQMLPPVVPVLDGVRSARSA